MIHPFAEISRNDNLRIIQHELVNGTYEYYIQKKFLFWWIYSVHLVGYDAYAYITFSTCEAAFCFIGDHEDNKRHLQTIKVKRKTVV